MTRLEQRDDKRPQSHINVHQARSCSLLKVTKQRKHSAVTAANSRTRRGKEQGTFPVSAHHLSMCQSDAETCSSLDSFHLTHCDAPAHSFRLTVGGWQLTGAVHQAINQAAILSFYVFYYRINMWNINNMSSSGISDVRWLIVCSYSCHQDKLKIQRKKWPRRSSGEILVRISQN